MSDRLSLDERIGKLMLSGTRGHRHEICKRDFVYFAVYYFPEYFTHRIPDFHYEFYDDCNALARGSMAECAWIAFRESAKTSIAKIFLIYLICHKLKSYINVDSYDKGNAESILFDITVALQTNPRLIADYGQLYHKKPQKDAMMEAKMKRIANFITENGVKVEAFSTQESTRGRIFKNIRPDFFLLDDFENNKTKDSYPTIAKIKGHIDEMRAGLPVNAAVLYLGNYITEGGVVESVMESMRNDPKRCKLRIVNIEDGKGNPLWPAKYAKTIQDANTYNETITDPRKRKSSIEQKKSSLGKPLYEAEMMNNPAHGGDKIFDREVIEELMKNVREPLRTVAGFKIWHEFRPDHRYAIGADTAKGIGRDSNASVVMDFSTVPNRVVATYKNANIPPDIFGYELKRQGELYGIPLIAPEVNNTGYATLAILKRIYPTNRIYVQIHDEKVKSRPDEEFGFYTDAATKPEMIYQFKKAIEDGLLVTYDMDLLEECKYYGMKDLSAMKPVDGMTRHFDLLTAAAICWYARNQAKMSMEAMRKRTPQQQAHIPAAGEFGG